MGWFSRSKVKKAHKASKQSNPLKPTLSDPSNVYSPPRPSPPGQNPPPPTNQTLQLPVRPATTAPKPCLSRTQLRPFPALPYNNQYASQSQPQFQPASYLPPPPTWNSAPNHPIIVNQHYYLGGQPGQQQQTQPNNSVYHSSLAKITGSMVNLTKDVIPASGITQLYDEGVSAWHGCSSQASQLFDTTNTLYDQVYSRFNDVMTLIDLEKLGGNESHLFNCQPNPPLTTSPPLAHGQDMEKSRSRKPHKQKSRPQSHVTTSVVSGNYFSKVEFYMNSKLPLDLPSLALYIPTWPLLCLAAQYSQRVYEKPTGDERDALISSDWRTGTKAMCIKSVPMDHMNTIVFAIRGTASFMDWAVNLNSAPVSPASFLDDPGNHCHAGFLSVAKKMVKPVAARLRQLLREDPSRTNYSLMVTGHSAGGAVAALLYSHMIAVTKEAESELNILTSFFKRIHCVTFGTPPVSLLPLTKPNRPELRKSLFLSFINEGDPVVRADKAYVKSLLELLAAPSPSPQGKDSGGQKHSSSGTQPSRSSSWCPTPKWKVPPCTLSNAGRLVVLRSGDSKARPKDRKTVRERLNEGVVAVTCAEEQLRDVIWGDPVCHLMSLYAGRIEVLAVGSITGKTR